MILNYSLTYSVFVTLTEKGFRETHSQNQLSIFTFVYSTEHAVLSTTSVLAFTFIPFYLLSI